MSEADAAVPCPTKSAMIALVGRANVGKSTLINALLEEKVSIVSPVPQTTRTLLRGILTEPRGQLVLLDTPGVHKPMKKLGEYMESAVEGTLREVDAVLFVVDAAENPGPGERFIVDEEGSDGHCTTSWAGPASRSARACSAGETS